MLDTQENVFRAVRADDQQNLEVQVKSSEPNFVWYRRDKSGNAWQSVEKGGPGSGRRADFWHFEQGPVSSVEGPLILLRHVSGETAGPGFTVKLETPQEDISLITTSYFVSIRQKLGLIVLHGYDNPYRFWFIPNKDLENLK